MLRVYLGRCVSCRSGGYCHVHVDAWFDCHWVLHFSSWRDNRYHICHVGWFSGRKKDSMQLFIPYWMLWYGAQNLKFNNSSPLEEAICSIILADFFPPTSQQVSDIILLECKCDVHLRNCTPTFSAAYQPVVKDTYQPVVKHTARTKKVSSNRLFYVFTTWSGPS